MRDPARKIDLCNSLVLILAMTAAPCPAQNRIGEGMSPSQVYDKAWNLIKDSFCKFCKLSLRTRKA